MLYGDQHRFTATALFRQMQKEPAETGHDDMLAVLEHLEEEEFTVPTELVQYVLR